MPNLKKYNLEHAMGVDFEDLNKRSQFCIQIKDILSEDINAGEVKRFVKDFSKYAEKKVENGEALAKTFDEEYCNTLKKNLKTLIQYELFTAIGKEDIFLKFCIGSAENDFIKEILFYLYKKIKKSIYHDFKAFTFFESKRPFLHKLRTMDTEFEDYRINNIKLVITFPYNNRLLYNDRIVRSIYFHTINWASNPKNTACISMLEEKSRLEVDVLYNLLRKCNKLNEYEFPLCDAWYKDKIIKLNNKRIFFQRINSKAKLYCNKSGFTAELKKTDKKFLRSPPCSLADLTIEIDCDMEYFIY